MNTNTHSIVRKLWPYCNVLHAQAVVDCIAPQPDEATCAPACGAGGFLFSVHNH